MRQPSRGRLRRDRVSQFAPALLAVLARDGGLRVVEREGRARDRVVRHAGEGRDGRADAGEGLGLGALVGVEQVLRLLLQVVETRPGREITSHGNSLLVPVVRKSGSKELGVVATTEGGSTLPADPGAP